MTWNPFSTAANWFARNGYSRMAAVLGYGSDSASGEPVSLQSMMTLSTVFACSKVLGESFGSLPCHVYEETKSGRERVSDGLSRLLHDRWNPWVTSMQGRESMVMWAANAGNAVARIEWQNDQPIALWPLHPADVRLERVQRGVQYFEREPNGTETPIPFAEVFHIPHICADGYLGMGIVEYAKHTVGNGLAAQKYAGKFFSHGGRVPGIIKVAQTFKGAEEQKAFREEWEKAYGGSENAHKNILLQGDVDFKPLGISPKDAQFIEWSAFSVPDVCRFYRVPPHMVMDLSRATFSNIEHQAIEYVNYTLMPWIVRFEQQIQAKLIDYDAMGRLNRASSGTRRYAKFNVNALLRGDFMSRMQGYASAIQNGIVNIDEVRALEDWNVLPSGAGQAHHFQLNMQTVPGTGKPTASEAATLAKVQAQTPKGEE